VSSQGTSPAGDALDALIAQLLDCGGVLSQIIGHMCEFEASGLSSPGLRPIPEIAHSVIRSVLEDLPKRHSQEAISASAEIVHEVTSAICDEIFVVPPDEIRRTLNGSASRQSHPRRRPRSRRRRG
jgi:hypothetical protein